MKAWELPGSPCLAQRPKSWRVSAPRFVPLAGDDVESSRFGHGAAQFDVRAPAGHVRGNGDSVPFSGCGHDPGLLLVPDRVEEVEGEAPGREHLGKLFTRPDAPGPHEHRPAGFVPLLDLPGKVGPLFLPRGIDQVRAHFPDAGPVGRYGQEGQFVDMPEFPGSLLGRPSHSAQPPEESKKTLETNNNLPILIPEEIREA
jgi:hypothetical protein